MTTYPLLPLLVIALGAVACSSPPAAARAAITAADDPALTEGRALTAAFFAGDTKTLWARFSPELRNLMKNDEANLAAFRDTGVSQLGTLREKTSERVTHEGDVTRYVQVAHFSNVGIPVEIAFGTAPSGTIVQFFVRPQKGGATAAPSTKLDYATRTTLRLPFDGAWDVAWGGRTIEQNQHAAVGDQRFAYDFVIIENGLTHRGDGAKNEDYFAYGKTILAPAAGTVVAAVNDVPENTPGKFATTSLAGNYVMLDHGSGEYSLLAHLVPGSVSVKAGDRVRAGQILGRCGNSGHSTEPHLHYHLQDSPKVGDAAGLPAPFVDYTKDGARVARGEPVRGERIASTLAR